MVGINNPQDQMIEAKEPELTITSLKGKITMISQALAIIIVIRNPKIGIMTIFKIQDIDSTIHKTKGL
jgi:hypothetical protein